MSAPLPRQTYKTAADAAAEEVIAETFAAWARASQLKIGYDEIDKQKSQVDRALYRGNTIVGFFEIKDVKYAFGDMPGWATGRRKFDALRRLEEIVRVPVLLVFRFKICGTIAYVKSDTPYTVKPFGRNDRNDPLDREDGAFFEWDQFKVIQFDPNKTI